MKFLNLPWFAGFPVAWVICSGIVIADEDSPGQDLSVARSSDPTELSGAIDALCAVGAEGKGHAEAQQAWRRVAQSDVTRLTEILSGMNQAGPLARNWLRGAVDAIAERAVASGNRLPIKPLEQFIADRSNSPHGRRLAYEWVASVDPLAPNRLLPDMLDDPSLELRWDAVQKVMNQAKAASGESALALYRKALNAGRDIDQIKACASALKELGKPIDLVDHFGFLTRWHIIGPFDNTDQQGFDVDYPPEREVNFSAEYDGKIGPVRWTPYTTDQEDGIVDVTKALDKHKGAVAYAAVEFSVEEARDVQLRLGTINAAKIWANGHLVLATEIYHSGMVPDQHVRTVGLKPGKNTILAKICQNEQTEDWAQRWEFQFRITDMTGAAIRSADAGSKQASR